MENKYELEFGEKKYVLQFDLESVMQMGDDGFEIDTIQNNPLKGTLLLFKGAFLKNHSGLYKNKDKIKEIWYAQKDRKKLTEELAKMYKKVIDDFFGIEEKELNDDEGND